MTHTKGMNALTQTQTTQNLQITHTQTQQRQNLLQRGDGSLMPSEAEVSQKTFFTFAL